MGERHGFQVAWIQGAADSDRSDQLGVSDYLFSFHAGIGPGKAICF